MPAGWRRGQARDDDWMIPVQQWRVFPSGTRGGNPCPLVTDARELTAGQMRAMAAHYGHESAFVTNVSGSTVTLRYFVPRHEMRMCVHATIAAVTALASAGILTGGQASISTASGEQRRPARPSWTRIAIDQGDAMGQPSRLHAAALAGPDGVTRPSVTGRAIRASQDELSPSALGDDLPEPELR